MTKNIKEIGKELLGKSLNSFHKKTGLTQLEKNNEMQDGILNGILSQVDDAYIEKTEQSNVIHLDGSGDGVVVLDSIEGDTLVNSLGANIIGHKGSARYVDFSKIKPNTTYTFIYDISNSTGTPNGCFTRFNYIDGKNVYQNVLDRNYDNGRYIVKYTTPNSWSSSYIAWFRNGNSETSCDFRMMVLEGDWTNKEIPSYFEGMQSSFEEKVNDEGKYEIEILMKNKNLLTFDFVKDNNTNISTIDNVVTIENQNILRSKLIKLKANTKYSFGAIVDMTNVTIPDSYVGTNIDVYRVENEDDKFGKWVAGSGLVKSKEKREVIHHYTPPTDMYVRICLTTRQGISGKTIFSDISVSKYTDNSNNYIVPKHNKIKLLINEPLRSVGDIRDKFVFKDNKLMIQRNVLKIMLDNNSKNITYTPNTTYSDNYLRFNYRNEDVAWGANIYDDRIYCDTFPNMNHQLSKSDCKSVRIHGNDSLVIFYLHKNEVSSQDANGFKEWLRNNPTSFVCARKEPIYEEVTNEYGEPILLEGYENGTLYIDSTIIPTTTVRYTPKMESIRTLKEVESNNNLLAYDINDNIIPYMMEVDLMIMEKEVALMSKKNIRKIGAEDMTNMQKRTQDMLERLIKGRTLTVQECQTRVTTYLNADKITKMQYDQLLVLIDSTYNG